MRPDPEDLYHELSCHTLAHPDPSFIHQHIVDARLKTGTDSIPIQLRDPASRFNVAETRFQPKSDFGVSSGSANASRLTRKSYPWYESTQDSSPILPISNLSLRNYRMLKTYCQSAPLDLPSAESAAPSLPEILSALSFALDLTEGAVPGHALRSCLLGMRLGSGARLFPDRAGRPLSRTSAERRWL